MPCGFTTHSAEEKIHELPLVLRVPGDGTDFDESLWSEAMVHEHLANIKMIGCLGDAPRWL